MLEEAFVEMVLRRNRGWPWPDDSWGLTPMFGEDGWCRACGTPLSEQIGSLRLQRKGMQAARGAWIPNWRFDAICLDAALAEEVRARFPVSLLPLKWPRGEDAGAFQLVVPSGDVAWFDRDELGAAARARHGTDGARCGRCGTWRWMPLEGDLLPPLCVPGRELCGDAVASPEWFGDGCQSFRQILVRRSLGELLVHASPRDFLLRDPAWR